MSKRNYKNVEEARKALQRLSDELEHPGGFNEYAQFSEELLIEILPHLDSRGLKIVKEQALSSCRLPE